MQQQPNFEEIRIVNLIMVFNGIVNDVPNVHENNNDNKKKIK